MPRIYIFILTVALCVSPEINRSTNGFAKDQDLNAEKVVAEHLKSIGNPESLKGIKSRAFVGTSSADFFQGMQGSMTGASMFVSEGHRLAIVMKYGDINYPGEYLAFDDRDVSVGNMKPGQRSPLADFIFRYKDLIKEGLLGGALSGSWPLLDLKDKQVELKYRQTTIDGRQLLEIEYQPKQVLRDMKIRMYFEPETYHHVRTEYQVRHRDDVSVSETPQAGNGRFVLREGVADSIYDLIEKFEDFQKTGDITLPHSYSIDYSVEGQGASFVGKWTLKANQWDFGKTYNERIFKAQK